MRGKALDGAWVEQIGIEADPAPAARSFCHRHRQVELEILLLQSVRFHGERFRLHQRRFMPGDEKLRKLGAACHEIGEQHLGQRHVAGYADRVQLLHHHRKRIVLMSQALLKPFLLTPQEIGECRVSIEACAQNDRVAERSRGSSVS